MSRDRDPFSAPWSWRVGLGAAAAAACAASLPFVRGILAGESFYFRDLSRQFFPFRHFVLEGLRRGELRYWNPLVHEGEPLPFPPISYPLDLLQLLFRDDWGLSLLLALHVPLAALAFLALGRGLGLAPWAAVAGGLVYALGGFSLSSLNLYVYASAVAWAPLVVLGVLRAARGGPREWVAGALVTAVALSTLGVEVVAQALLLGLVLSASRREPKRFLRMGASLLLALGLAAPTLLVVQGLVAGSERAQGFTTKMMLADSLHPVRLIQVVVGGLFGDPAHLVDRFWGLRFFADFPYFLSLYLGVAALVLATVGALRSTPYRGRILLVLFSALLVSLGRFAGFEGLVEAVPDAMRSLRYPSKAFFSVHFAVALLAALGADSLVRGRDRRGWRWLASLGLPLGAILALAPLLPRVTPGLTLRLLTGFFPTDYPWPQRYEIARFVLHDVFLGGTVALAVGLVALLVLWGRARPGAGLLAVVCLLAADLLRSGAGLNPTVKPTFFRLSPEMSMEAARMREAGGRVFTCDPELSDAFWEARRGLRGSFEVWTVATLLETSTPHFNMRVGLPAAYGRDLTMLTPMDRVLAPEEAGCRSFEDIAERLWRGGVAHVLSLGPIDHPRLRLESVVEPSRLSPAAVYRYALLDPRPLRSVARHVRPAASRIEAAAGTGQAGLAESGAVLVEGIRAATSDASGRVASRQESPGRLELEVEADRQTVVVVRDAYAPGWVATVDGSPAPVLRADGRHRAVPVPPGRSRVVLVYRPPGLRAGLAVAFGAWLLCGLLWTAGARAGARDEPDPGACVPAGQDGSRDVEQVSVVRETPFPDEWYRLTEPGHFWFQWRLGAAIRQVRDLGIPMDRPLKVLEIGAGSGVLRDQLEATTDWAVDITDLNLEALHRARRGRGRTLYYDVLEQRAGFVGSYDLVVLFDVLEHIEKRGPFLESVIAHLQPGGTLLVNVPALQSLHCAYDVAAGHVLRYDRSSLAAELAGLDLVVRDLRYWGLSLVPLLAVRKLVLRGRTPNATAIRTGFRPPGPVIHALLRGLMRLELAVRGHGVPLGSGLLLAGRKPGA